MDDTLNDSDILEKTDIIQIDSQTDEETSAEVARSEDSIQQMQVEEKSDVAGQKGFQCVEDVDVQGSTEDQTSDCSLITHFIDESPQKKQDISQAESIVILSSDEEKEADSPSQCPALALTGSVAGESTEENVKHTSESEVDMFSSQLDSRDQAQYESMECEDIIPSSQEDIVEDISSAQIISSRSCAEIPSRILPCKRKLENGEESSGKILCVEKHPSTNEPHSSPELLESVVKRTNGTSPDRNEADSSADIVLSVGGDPIRGEKIEDPDVRDHVEFIEESESEDDSKNKNNKEGLTEKDNEVTRKIDETVKNKDEMITCQGQGAKNDTRNQKTGVTDTKSSLELPNDALSHAVNNMEVTEITGKNQSDVQILNSDRSEDKNFQPIFNLKLNKIISDTTISLSSDAKSDDNTQDILESVKNSSIVFRSDEAVELGNSVEDDVKSSASKADFTLKTNRQLGDTEKSVFFKLSVCDKVEVQKPDLNIKSTSSKHNVNADVLERHNESCTVLKLDDISAVPRSESQDLFSEATMSEEGESKASKLESVVLEPLKPKHFDASKLEDVIADASKLEDVVADASKLEDVADASKLEDVADASKLEVVVAASKLKDVVADASKLKDVVADASRLEDVVASASRLEDVTASASKLEDVIVDASKSENVIGVSVTQEVIGPSKSEDVIHDASQLEDGISNPSKLGNGIVNASKSKDVISDPPKPEDVVLDLPKLKDAIRNTSKSEDVNLDAFKSVDVILDSSKSGDVVLDASKPEEMVVDISKSEDTLTDASKLENLILDARSGASKLEDESDIFKQRNMISESSKSGNVIPEATKSNDINDACESEDMITDTSMSENITDVSVSEVVMDASMSEDVITDVPMLEDVRPAASILEDVIPESTKSEGMVSEASKSEDVIPETSKSEDVIPETSKSEDVIPETSKSEDVIPETSKSDDMILEISKSEDVILEVSKSTDVIPEAPKSDNATSKVSATSQLGDVISEASMLENVILEASKSADVIPEAPKSDNEAPKSDNATSKVLEASNVGDVISEASKSKEVISEASKLEEVISEASKLEEVISEASKLEEVVSEASKLEEVVSEASKLEEVISEASKSKDVISEASKSEDVISYAVKSKDVHEVLKPDASKTKNEELSAAKSEDVIPDTSTLDNISSYASKSDNERSHASKSGDQRADDHVNTSFLKPNKFLLPCDAHSDVSELNNARSFASKSDDAKSNFTVLGDLKSVVSKSSDVKSDYSKSDNAATHASMSVSEISMLSNPCDRKSNVSQPCEFKFTSSTLIEAKPCFPISDKAKPGFAKSNGVKPDEVKSDSSYLDKLTSGLSKSDIVKSNVLNLDNKLKTDVSKSDNMKNLNLFESSSLVQEECVKPGNVTQELKKHLGDECALSPQRVKYSSSPVKHVEDNNFMHPKMTPSKHVGRGMEAHEFDADGSLKSNDLDVSDSQDFNLCISLSPNTSTQSTDNIHLENTSSKHQHSQEIEEDKVVEIRPDTLKDRKVEEQSLEQLVSEETDRDCVLSNGFADTHEVMVCSPTDNKISGSDRMDSYDDSIVIISEEDIRPTRKKEESITGQIKRKRPNDDADVIEYIDIANEASPQPEDERFKKKLRTLQKEDKMSPLNSSELGIMGNNSTPCDRNDSSFESDITSLSEKFSAQRLTAVQYKKIVVAFNVKIVYDKHTKEVLSRTVTQCEELKDDRAHPLNKSSDLSSGYLADSDGKTSPGSVTSTGPYPLMPKQMSRLSTASTSSSLTSGSYNSGTYHDMKNVTQSFSGSAIMPPPKEIPKERSSSREDNLDKSSHQISSPAAHVIRNYDTLIQFLDQVTEIDNSNISDGVYRVDYESKKSESKLVSGGEISSSSDANGHVKGESDVKPYVIEAGTPKTSRKTYTRVVKRSGLRVKVIPESEVSNESPSGVNSAEKLMECDSPARSPQIVRGSRRARNKLNLEDGKASGHSVTTSKTPGSSEKKAGVSRRRTGPEKEPLETQVVDRPKTPETYDKPPKPETPKSESISSEPKTPEAMDGVRGDQIEPGVSVFARWTDKKYYSGKVKNKVQRDKWLVEFDDGNSKALIQDFIIVCTELNRGQSVYAMDRHRDFHSGVIRDFKLSKGEVVYGVELDDTEEQLFVPRSKISMSEDQANLLRESAYDTSFTSLTPKGSSSVTLDNLVEGKRVRKLSQVQLERPHSSGTVSNIKPRRARSDASSLSDAGDKTSSASDFVGGVEPESYPCMDLIVTSSETGKTPSKGGKSYTKSSGKSKSKVSEDPDILSLLGPIPSEGSTIFAGKCFLLTCSDIDHVHTTFKKKTASGKKGKKRSSDDSSEFTSSDDPSKMAYPFDKNRLTKQLMTGGGTVYENFHDVPENKYTSCLLIANKALQTAKYLLCLAHSIPIVQHKWVIDSVKQGCEVERSQYYLHAGWSLEDNMYKEWKNFPRTSRKPLQGLSVYIVNEAGIFFKFWNKILTALGASATHLVDSQDLATKPDVILTDWSCFDEVVREAELHKIQLVSTTWVVQCLINWRRCGYNAHIKYRYNAPD